MMLRCWILGHDGPWWLDFKHQGHCRRCREPHPEWLRMQERESQFKALMAEARTKRGAR